MYQGRLVDNGQPASGTYDLRFILTDAVTGGSQVGTTLTRAPLVVSNGYFMVTLDFGSAAFDGSARWLEIGVRTNGSASPYTPLTPRQPITAAPYATFANAAATASVAATLTPGAIIVANGAGITNLSGANLAPGTVGSSALDAATWLLATQQLAAMVVAAGTNVTIQTNGGLYTISATGVGAGTVTNLLAGDNSISPIMGALPTTDAVVYRSLDTNLVGTYTLLSVDPLYDQGSPADGGVTNWAKGDYTLSFDSWGMFLSHPVMLYSNGVEIRYSDNWEGPGGLHPAWRSFSYMNGNSDTNSHYGMESNSFPVGWAINGTFLGLTGAVLVAGNQQVLGSLAVTGTIYGSGAALTNLPHDSYTNLVDRPLADTVVDGRHRLFPAPPRTINVWEDGGLPQSGATLSNVANSLIAWGLSNTIRYINLDDGWQGSPKHDANHFLLPNTTLFPEGVKAPVDYLHQLGFKVGLYLAFVNLEGWGNCYPEQEAQSLCNWGVDYIKLDGCATMDYVRRFAAVADSNYLAAGRSPMFISQHTFEGNVPPWSDPWDDPRLWTLPNSVFSTGDISKEFALTMTGYAQVAGQHRLFTRSVPQSAYIVSQYYHPEAGRTNARSLKTEIGAMAMLSADLQAYHLGHNATNILKPSAEIIAAITNADVVAINQDPAQVVGWLHSASSTRQVWMKPLGSPTGPEWAVMIANLISTANTSQTTYFSLTNIPNAGRIMYWKELWSGTTGFATDGLLVTNWPCESKLFHLSPYTAEPASVPSAVPYNLLSTTNTPSAGQVLTFDGTNLYWANP